MTEMVIVPASILAVLAACVGIVVLCNYLEARIVEAEKSRGKTPQRCR